MPKGRRIDFVKNDIRMMSVRNWRTEGKDRHGLWRILEEANTHIAL
jgi:hypothetical protein